MDSKNFGKLLSAAVVALMAGGAAAGCKRMDGKTSSTATMGMEKHACKGMNACKGQGGCKSDNNGCAGKNSCKGKGGCAVPVKAETKKEKSSCKAKGSCKGV